MITNDGVMKLYVTQAEYDVMIKSGYSMYQLVVVKPIPMEINNAKAQPTQQCNPKPWGISEILRLK